MSKQNHCLLPHPLSKLFAFSQGLWFDKGSALWMLPCMSDDLASSLSKRGISTVQQLLVLPKPSLQAMIGSFPASILYQVCSVLFDFGV